MIQIQTVVRFHCQLGRYMTPPPLLVAPQDFSDCLYDCPAGVYGARTNLTDASCSGRCWPGHYCGPATVTPEPCPAGHHLPTEIIGSSRASCIPCSPGQVSICPVLSNKGPTAQASPDCSLGCLSFACSTTRYWAVRLALPAVRAQSAITGLGGQCPW